MNLTEILEKHFNKFSSPPYMFVGSGVARRYLGLQDWAGLLRAQCDLHGLDFGYLSSSAKGDLPLIASGMAEELHQKWWKERKYKNSRDAFGHLAVSNESALKFEISKHIGENVAAITDAKLLAELDTFKRIVVDGIVTTNWDGLLEALFPDYAVFIGQEELLFGNIQGIGEIYKIHGSYTDPNSLILTSGDYEEFHHKNPYLASKLLTFFVENPVVFLGYSLTDKNILDIIHSILNCLSSKNVEKLADRLVFVQWDPECKEGRFERTILSNDGRSLPVFQATADSFVPVLDALTTIQRRIPAKVLRILKKQVFDLVHTTQPSDRVFVQDINDDTDLDQVELAIGVGIQERLRDRGYTALDRADLARDILFADGEYRAEVIIRDTLPELLKKTPYIPIFKYLKEASSAATWDAANLNVRLAIAREAPIEKFRPKGVGKTTARAIASYDRDFDSYARQNDVETTVNHAGLLPVAALKIEQLHQFLADNFALAKSPRANVLVNYFKLICIYDILRFRE